MIVAQFSGVARGVAAASSLRCDKHSPTAPIPSTRLAAFTSATTSSRPSARTLRASRDRKATMVRASPAGPAKVDEMKALIDKVDCFIFDCDGVIWKGDSLIEGVPETLEYLRAQGKKLFFVTNNSTKSRKGYLNKFTSLGLSITPEEIYSSSYAAAAYLESVEFPRDKKVYVVGEVGIQEELDLKGIAHFGGPADAGKTIELTSGFYLEHDEDVAAVIVGFDRNINYHKIQYATLCIRENPGCMFIATNTDAVTHLTDAQEWAGNGSMVGAIKGSTKREPTVVGKPSDFMLDNIAKTNGLARHQICMVGDRLDTDIMFGINGGLTTMLVLSGVTSEEELRHPENSIHPHMYTSKLPDLLQVKESASVPA